MVNLDRIDLTTEILDAAWSDLGHPNHMIATLRIREDISIMRPLLQAARRGLECESELRAARELAKHLRWGADKELVWTKPLQSGVTFELLEKYEAARDGGRK